MFRGFREIFGKFLKCRHFARSSGKIKIWYFNVKITSWIGQNLKNNAKCCISKKTDCKNLFFLEFLWQSEKCRFYWIYRCQTQNPTYIREIAKTRLLQSPVKLEPFNILTSGFLCCARLSLKISENLNVVLFK